MLIQLLLELAKFIITPLLNIIATIFNFIGINEIMQYINKGLEIIFQAGAQLTGLVFDFTAIKLFLSIVLTVQIAYQAYRITMWAIKKIPKFNVS